MSDNKKYVDANEVSEQLDVSKSVAYKIIRDLNKTLKENGYIVIAGRCPRAYFNERYYGYGELQHEDTNTMQDAYRNSSQDVCRFLEECIHKHSKYNWWSSGRQLLQQLKQQ